MEEIRISDIKGFRIGSAQDEAAGTGCTAVICEDGAMPGGDVRGGGPASRETASLESEKMCESVHCVMLSGGSAYGLASCDGAMRFLEEHGSGFMTPAGIVPIVTGACIFDLGCGDSSVRPGPEMGYAACEDAYSGSEVRSGNFGAGTGATVGKLDPSRKMKAGLGSYAVRAGHVSIGAVTSVNSFGNVYDYDTGRPLAGMMDENGKDIVDITRLMYEKIDVDFEPYEPKMENTCITCIITDAALEKRDCNRIAQIAHNGYAKTIAPVHTSADGDAIFVLSYGDKKADVDTLAMLAVEVTGRAINNAVLEAKTAYGVKAACDL
ncbi:MAG: P1 family peptidase [Anaerovoracaceae bacterium]|nr:P1 family peptidase [Anaerovoracaceae bacterium]